MTREFDQNSGMSEPESTTEQPGPDLLSVKDKYSVFVGLPIPAQKLLVGCIFASSVRPKMAQLVSKTTDEEFEEAKTTLLETPFLSQTETDRRDFINTDLKKIWQEQQRKNKRSE